MVTPINVTGDTGLSPEMKTFYAKKMLENLWGSVVYNLFGEPGILKGHDGKSIEWRRMAKLTKDLTPLTEGVTPAGDNLEVTTVTATATQNGRPVFYSDVLKTTTIDPIIEKATSETLPMNASETLEEKAAQVVCAGTNVLYAGSNTARSTVQDTDIITPTLIRKAVRDLKKNNCPKFPDQCFRAICSPDTTFDVQSDDEWKKPHQYQMTIKDGIYPTEIGKFHGTRFFESTYSKVFKHQGAGTDALHTTLDAAAAAGQKVIPLTSTTGLAAGDICTIRDSSGYYEQEITIDTVSAGVSITAIENLELAYASGDSFDKGDDVFATVVFGPGAYGVVNVAGLAGNKKVGMTSFELIVKAIGSEGSGDPLNQRGSIGWKSMNKTVILDDLRIIRLEHGASDATS